MTTIGAIIQRVKAAEGLIVTPRLDQWLIQHPEGLTVPPELFPVLQRLVSSPNANRASRFGASGRGSCLRQQVFTYLGMPPLMRHDPVLQNLFNDGTWRHIRWQLTLLVAGIATDVEVEHRLPQWYTKVSTDAENSDEGWGLELKGRGWIGKVVENGVPERHMKQVHTYFLATGYDRFIYIAEDKRTNNWQEIIVRPNRSVMHETKEELHALADAVEDAGLPAPLNSCRAQKGEDFRGCPYRHECLGQDTWPTPGTWGSPLSIGRRNGQPGSHAGRSGRDAGGPAGAGATADQ